MNRPADLQTPQGQTHLEAIDGLKGVVICILLVHYNAIEVPSGALEQAYHLLVRYSLMTLDIFFVVSGFLITGILLRSKRKPRYFVNFYARRSLRIFPLYYTFLLAYFFVLPRLRPGSTGALHVDWLPWFFGYLANVYMAVFGDGPVAPTATIHLWSLSVEEQFYLLWPIVVRLCGPRTLKRICVTMAVLAPLIRCGFMAGGHEVAAFMLTPCRMDSLAIGALLAVWNLEPGGLERRRRGARFLLAVAVLAALPMLWTMEHIAPMSPLAVTALLVCASLHAGALVLLAVTRGLGRIGNGIVTFRPLVRFGLFSYAIYMLHDPIAWVGERMGYDFARFRSWCEWRLGAQLLYTATFTVLTYVASYLSWHLLEKHFLSWKRFFAPRQTPIRSAEVEVSSRDDGTGRGRG